MLEDPRLSSNNVRVHRRDNYEKRPVLSATIHPDLKRTLAAMSERTGLRISQVSDEVYTLDWLRCRSYQSYKNAGWGSQGPPIDT
jgi:hypothetical protein